MNGERGADDEDLHRAIGSLEEAAPEQAPEHPEPPGQSPNAAPARRGPGRPPKEKPAGLGASDGAGANAPWKSNMAIDLANEVAERLRDYPAIGNAYDLDCKIFPLDGSGERLLGTIKFGELGSNELPPGQMLHNLVTDRVHMHYLGAKGGPVDYLVSFSWRRSGKWYAKGKLPLGSIEEIVALRRGLSGAPAGYGGYAPPQQQPYYPPPQGQPPQGQGYGAPPPAAGAGGELDSIRRDLSELRGALSEALGFARDRAQQPQAGMGAAAAAAAGVGQPPAGQGLGGITADHVVRLVVTTLKELGVPMGGAAAGAAGAPASPNGPQAAAPAPRPPDPMDEVTSEIRGMLTGVLREGVGMVMRNIKDGIKQGFQPVGTGAPVAEEPPEVEPAEPKPEPPFYTHDVGSKWADGRPVVYPQGADGEIDWRAVPFANPIIAEKGMDLAATVGRSIGDAAKVFAERMRVPDGAAQVVSKIPRGAQDGTPKPGAEQAAGAQGVGAPPVSPNRSAAPANGVSEPARHAPPPEPPPARRAGGGFPSV